METNQRNRLITRIYDISRAIILIVFLGSLLLWAATADAAEHSDWIPTIHGTVRGKFEYQPDLSATRFEVRNARVSVDGLLPFGIADTLSPDLVLKRGVRYKAEIDLSDEGTIKMLDAYVQVRPFRSLHFTLGQMRVPFSIDAHRSPHQQYFANRSFIAKQVGNVRDVGLMMGYTWYYPTSKPPLRGGLEGYSRPVVMLDAGLYNGSGLTAQKTAWHRDINFSARAQFFPFKPWNITLSTQRSRVGTDSLHYVSFDAGTYYHDEHWHAEVEYLHKRYFPNQYVPVHAVDAFLCYTHTLKRRGTNAPIGKRFALSYLARYDYMSEQELTDAERHRLTAGLTLHMVLYRQLAADLRLNYEQYWYAGTSELTTSSAPTALPKESEQSKLVAELMLHF